MPLMIVCKSCGGKFTSNYQMSSTSEWHKPNSTISIEQRCPECGKTHLYAKIDHFFQ
jgi:ribosomal protein L37AE/L43A